MVLLTAAMVLVIVAVVAFTFASTGGGSGQGSGTPTGPDSAVVLSVEQASLAEEGQDIRVSGYLVSAEGKTVLATSLAESMPPQAGGPTIGVVGLDLADIVGLSTSAGQAGAASVTWSDSPVVLQGVAVSGVFEVRKVPRVEEAALGDLVVRFSPVAEPVFSGDQVWWALDVTNNGQSEVELTFSDGQRGDVSLVQGETEVYAWSAGKSFTQAIETIRLEPGKTLSVVLTDTLTAPPGTYDVTALVTALAGPEDTAAPLPAITSTLVVR